MYTNGNYKKIDNYEEYDSYMIMSCKIRMWVAKSFSKLVEIQNELCNELEMPYEYIDIKAVREAMQDILNEKDEGMKAYKVKEHIDGVKCLAQAWHKLEKGNSQIKL